MVAFLFQILVSAIYESKKIYWSHNDKKLNTFMWIYKFLKFYVQFTKIKLKFQEKEANSRFI